MDIEVLIFGGTHVCAYISLKPFNSQLLIINVFLFPRLISSGPEMPFLIVEFNDPEGLTTEVVPEKWLRGNQCYWPRNSSNVLKEVKRESEPNPNSFFLCPACQLHRNPFGEFLRISFSLNLK